MPLIFPRYPTIGGLLLSMTPGTEKRLRDERLNPSRFTHTFGGRANFIIFILEYPVCGNRVDEERTRERATVLYFGCTKRKRMAVNCFSGLR
jgi:hypothetical protein